MKIGIIQGRLSPPNEGFQECPEDWKREFNLLGALDLNHIEWIVTKETYDFNPIHTENLKKYPRYSAVDVINEREARTLEPGIDFKNKNIVFS